MSTRGWTQRDVDAHRAKFGLQPDEKAAGDVPVATPRMPNQTEQEAFDILGLLHRGCIYEVRTFDVVGHKFTPDWTGPDTAVEVKGPHVFSRDSRILFDAARLAHPELTWIWIQKKQGGKKGDRWEATIWQRKA